MKIVNESVEHIMFGPGVITEVKDNMLWVQFQNGSETKAFQYPEAFEKFLKAIDTEVEENILEELHRKQEQMELEWELGEEEREAAEMEEKKARLQLTKKKSAVRTTKKKS